MNEISIVGVDLAKNVIQLHAATAQGAVAFRKKVGRLQFMTLMTKLPRCCVAMEACATAHFWGRTLQAPGHQGRLIPPVYVKPFVKRQKNDAADAEAILEAARRPSMRSVEVKSEAQQARAMLFRTREMLVGQRTSWSTLFGLTWPNTDMSFRWGSDASGALAPTIVDPEIALPPLVRDLARLHLDKIEQLSAQLAELDKRMVIEAKASRIAARLQRMPGIGSVNAMAIKTFAPTMTSFERGRDCSAWLGLVPRQHSSGGKVRLGRTSKMGQRDIRRLLIVGAMSAVIWKGRGGGTPGSWLARMLARKPRPLVAIALANKMARAI